MLERSGLQTKARISPGSVGGVPIMCQTVKVNMASAATQLLSDTPVRLSTRHHAIAKGPVCIHFSSSHDSLLFLKCGF